MAVRSLVSDLAAQSDLRENEQRNYPAEASGPGQGVSKLEKDDHRYLAMPRPGRGAHRGWSGRPQLRTGERGHRPATWFELFYDLAFVVIVGEIGQLVVAHPGWRSVGQAALLFIPAWWSWV